MTQTLSLADIEAFARDCLTRAGVPPHVAHPVAVEIAAAEAAGDRAHGLLGLLRDIRLLRYGRLLPEAPVKLHHPRPGVLVLDAGHGFAAAALTGIAADLAQTALSQGVALLRLTRSSAPGAMIGPLTRLRQDGLLAMALTDQGPVRTGGCEARSHGTTHAGDADDDDPTRTAPVDHRAQLIVADPETVGSDAFGAMAPAAPPVAPPHRTVTLEADLLARIVAA